MSNPSVAIAQNEFDLESFEANGYWIGRNILDIEMVNRTRCFLQERLEYCQAFLCKTFGVEDTFALTQLIKHLNKNDLDISQYSDEFKSILSGHFDLQTRLDPALWGVASEPLLQAILKKLFQTSHLRMHMPPTARFVFPGNQFAAVPAHQDISYNKHMGNFVTVWVPFTTIDELCGGVRVFPEMAPKRELLDTMTREFWLNPLDIEGNAGISCYLNPGDVLVFNQWIVHSSVPNLSEKVRLSVDYRFFGGSSASTKHYLDLSTRQVIAPNFEGTTDR